MPIRENAGVVVGALCLVPAVERFDLKQDADAVAEIDKAWRGRIVAGADRVAAHFLEEAELTFSRFRIPSGTERSEVVVQADSFEVLRRFPEVSYLGVIGSASKRAVLIRQFREDGVGERLLKTIVCPVGLPLGGNDPAEIAISIAAQLLERRG